MSLRRAFRGWAGVASVVAALLVTSLLGAGPAQAETSRTGLSPTLLVQFNSGLHYYHRNGAPGPGVNGFQVLDKCEDGLSPGVAWMSEGDLLWRTKDLPDTKCPQFLPWGYQSTSTNEAPDVPTPMKWYAYLKDASGKIVQRTEPDTDDWMGSYSYEAKPERFYHVSVYREPKRDDDFTDQTFTMSMVPTADTRSAGSGDTEKYWEEVQERTPLPEEISEGQRESLYKQLWCHTAFGSTGQGGPTWDLEAWRDNIPWGQVVSGIADHHCNWGDSDGGYYYRPPTDDNEPEDLAPVVNAGPDVTVDEGSDVTLDGEVWDDGGKATSKWTYRPVSGVDEGASCTFSDASSTRSTLRCTDDGTYRVTLTADDKVNRPAPDSATVTVRNVAPKLSLAGPKDWDVHRVGDTVRLKATFTDPGSNDTHTCEVTWDDGTVDRFPAADGNCSTGHAFDVAGMDTIKVRVTDDDRGSDSGRSMVVVYDPRAGLLTAAGALGDGAKVVAAAKYPTAGSTKPLGTVVLDVPDGQGRTKLVSTRLDWLVITPDGKAAVKGRSATHGYLGYARNGKFRGVVWPLSAGDVPPRNATYDSTPGASWDVDEAEPQPMALGVTVIDSGWLPGLPDLPIVPGLLDDLLPGIGLDLS
ncbi:DUF2599 domain-containing protein [Streptomyces sp. NPDC050256]|uniref:DUF2599 domain-containing protein n=1 Tax=Streptomyces sp. NPDC050256 TaxID=3365607 RepID=UPI00379CC110